MENNQKKEVNEALHAIEETLGLYQGLRII